MNMKRIIISVIIALVSLSNLRADDRPVMLSQLPEAAQAFINKYYPNDKVSFATVDDDLIAPDYQVALVSGVMMQFSHKGKLEKIESRNGSIPEGIIPIQIIQAVKGFYPDASILGYEVDWNSHEVKLSNRLELKFNNKYKVVDLDD